MTNEQEEEELEHGLGRLESPEPEPNFPETLGEDESPEEEDDDGVPAGPDNNQPGH